MDKPRVAGGRTVPADGRKMDYTMVTRIDIEEASWRAFRGMCIERGQFVPDVLGALVRGYVKRMTGKPRRVYERRG
jgi:hypothetical protein